jgi:HlyD family secretion protein
VAGIAVHRRSGAAGALPAFETEPLRRGDIALTVTATGTLQPITQVTVGSELSGIVLRVFVDTNDRVTKGQALAELDTTKLLQTTETSRASERSAEAGVAQVEATLRQAEAALARDRELRRISAGTLPSQADFDVAVATEAQASANLKSAQAAVDQARAQVRSNEYDLSQAVIRSPIDGIVLTRSVEPGQTVAASFTAPELFVIAQKLERMKLNVGIAEADIGRVAPGDRAEFTVDAWPSRLYAATVSKVAYGSDITDNVVTYQTELDVANDDLSLRPGMTATADVSVASRTGVFVVPTAALRFDPAQARAALEAVAAAKKASSQSLLPGANRDSAKPPEPAEDRQILGSARIWTLRNGRPVAVPVQLGISDGRQTEISGPGLAEGLPVVTRANTPGS